MTQSGPATFDPLAAARRPLLTPLARRLAARIQRDGPLSFRDWMAACLYAPQHGYYRRGRATVGRDGDFLTSPEVHPLFGAAIGHAVIALWRQLDCPAVFRVAEAGPGTGALAESILRHLLHAAPDLADAVHYTAIEPDEPSARAQRERLGTIHEIHSVHAIEQLTEPQQLVIANELLDALPVHRLRFIDGGWRELLVDYAPAAGFQDVAAPVADQRLLEPLRGMLPSEGQILEVSPERAAVTAALAGGTAEPGLLLLFDYGYPRARLYAPWRRDGTLMTFRRHIPGDDPYAHPGEQDITAHIDLDQVREAGQAAGLTPLPSLSQSQWLQQLGAAALPAVADAHADTNTYLAARRAAETLTDPAGLGRIAVIGFSRGAIGPLPGWGAS